MAETKIDVQLVAKEAVAEYVRSTKNSQFLRSQLREILSKQNDEAQMVGGGDELYRRAVEDRDDPFESLYDQYRLKEPIYNFQNLWQIFEESDVLQSCVDAYQKNIDGFGYQMLFLGDDIKDKDLPVNSAQLTKAKNFFDRVNEEQSFATVRQLMRQDVEVIGNGGLEVIRNLKGEVAVIYHMPFKYVRMSAMAGESVVKKVMLPRDGKMIPVKIRKYYRKFAQLRADGKRLRWFKEFGDPRPMNALTGEIGKIGEKAKNPASEIWHFKIPFGGLSYGLPRWIGAILSVMGRRLAEFVNYDLFENQGIPPMVALVSGGTLTDESMKTLTAMMQGLRGAGNFNRVWLLEALMESVGLEDRGSVKLDLKNLTDFRKEDQMFTLYLEGTEKVVRHRFRLPPLYVGAAETFTHATAKAAQTVAEEQVFVPERQVFDERVTNQLLPELGVDQYVFKSKGPRVVGAADISTALKTFTDAGGFSINHAIDRANEAFGLEMSKFKEPWADYPVPVIIELIKQGKIAPSDIIQNMEFAIPAEPPKPTPPKQVGTAILPNQKLLEGPGKKEAVIKKVERSKDFTSDEKILFKLIMSIQNKLEGIEIED
jgi:PBSX family phage portal protein